MAPEDDYFNEGTMGLEANGRQNAPGITTAEKMFYQRLMNLAGHLMFNGKFKPLLSNFSTRELTILAQAETLIRILNRPESIPEDWKDQVQVVSEIRLQMLRSPFELVTDEIFTRTPAFILRWKNIPQKSVFLANLKNQIQVLEKSRFFMRFLYKLTIADTEFNVEEVDESLESTGQRMDLHHDIFVPARLQKVKRALIKEMFCVTCAQGFQDMEGVISHVAKSHKDLISPAAQEEIRSSREEVKLAEQYEAFKCFHNLRHPDCEVCFRH